jgi:lincosamide nucleotidyltransferase A/C/D/E
MVVTTTADDVVRMLDLIESLETVAIIGGGWGIDALVGAATREHHDLDVLVPERDVDRVVAALSDRGFLVTTDWRPVRIELTDEDNERRIDIHPAIDDEAGGYWQHGFGDDRYTTPSDSITSGVIGGRAVHCFTVEKQLDTHQGYEPTATDLADLETLRRLAR